MEINTYWADILVANGIGRLNQTTYFVSSGVIGFDEGTFFIPSDSQVSLVSTNIVQPVFSTLSFNSTLFVSREAVGINTNPFYTLDVASEALVRKNVIVTQSTSITGAITSVLSTDSLWLAVTSNDGLSNILASSNEGVSWSPFPPLNLFEGAPLLNIATDGGPLQITTSNTVVSQPTWVAVGAPQGEVYRQGNDSWTFLEFTNKLPNSNYGIAYNGQIWVLTGVNSSNVPPETAPTLHWSFDGINWTAASAGGFTWDGISRWYGGRSVAWNGSLWVAVGKGASTANSILYSKDGRIWQDANTGGFADAGYGVAWSGSNWVATGANGNPTASFVVSSDGSNWLGVLGYGFDGLVEKEGRAIASDGRLLVAVGTYTSASSNASIQVSEDGGYSWTNATGTLFNTNGDEGASVVWNGSYWLAGGASGVRKSLDGRTWTQPPGTPTQRFQGMAYLSNAKPLAVFGESNYRSSIQSTVTVLTVACGVDVSTVDSNCLRYSEDGSNWSNAESGWFTEQGRAALFNGTNLWVAAGKGMMSNFVYSGDGKNWSNGLFSNFISATGIGTGLAYGAGGWVGTVNAAGGGGKTLWYSQNGVSWSNATDDGLTFTNAGLGVAYGPSFFVAVGDDAGSGNTILYSTSLPAQTWSATGVTNPFSSKGTAIAYGASLWVASGYDATATLKYSGDGSNWSNGTGTFSYNGNGVAYNGSNLWIAAGNGGGVQSNLLYSGDGINWSNTTSGAFLTAGEGVTYVSGRSLWIAAGWDAAGIGTLKYSGDGLNWSNASGGFDSLGYGVGSSEVTVSSISLTLNQLRLYNTPGTDVPTRDSVANLSYTSTSLTLNNTVTLDRFATIGIQGLYPGLVSTFYDAGLAQISSFVSSMAVQVGGFFLSGTFV